VVRFKAKNNHFLDNNCLLLITSLFYLFCFLTIFFQILPANTEIAKEKVESPKIQQEAGNCVEVISEEITTNIKTILANTEITKEDAESPNIHKNAGNFFGEEVMSEETTTYNTTIVANTEITCWVGNVDLIASRDE